MKNTLLSQIIEQSFEDKNPFLDLGSCGLTELPIELLDMPWVTQLSLGLVYLNEDGEEIESTNQGSKNQIGYQIEQNSRILKGMPQLVSLNLSGNKIIDISFVEYLKNLKLLYLHNNKISDISFLKDLKQLSALDLSFNLISNISFLKDLKQLKSLCLSKNRISDISFLKNLKQLNLLELSGTGIIDVSFLKDLKQLNSLDLSKNFIVDISSLQKLNQLISLRLNSNYIQNISHLQNLTQLKKLFLSINSINDISYLKSLKLLNSLNLSENQLENISFLKDLLQLSNLDLTNNKIIDISFLQNLKQLKELFLRSNQIADISFLQNLKQLNFLYLSDNQITDIPSLRNLKHLIQLDLSENQISDISFLRNLNQIKVLCLSQNIINDIQDLEGLDDLGHLELEANPIAYIPKELYNKFNCAFDIKSYWQELKNVKKTTNTQLKIMFLGNGCTGKTTLLHWFIDNEFKDIGLESRTHGIFIKPLKLCKGEVLGNFWDFGGQEVYHATHRLFLGRRTLYILVWATETPETENELSPPPQYWLDMIADIADKNERSRVLIVQNLFENQAAKYDLLTAEEIDNYTAQGLDIEFINTNAKTGKNIPSFKLKVEEEARDLLTIKPEILPETWVNIRTKVAERRENKEKTLAFADFEQICVDCKLVGTPSVILGYLHRAGEVFYYEKQFNNQIILDQEWALKAVYAVLKRANIDQFNGRFKLKDLIAIWQTDDTQLTVEDTKVFLNFMLSNHIMFTTKEHNHSDKETEFVIPQLLSEEIQDSIEANQGRPDSLIHQIDYAFLHRDIIERFIVKMAQFSEKKEYWRNGVFIKYGDTRAIIYVKKDEKEKDKPKIYIECFGTNKVDLLLKIREEFNKIRTLDKATEYQFVNNNWQVFDAKLDQKEVEKSGFPATPTIEINNIEKTFLIMELLKKAIELVTDVYNNKAVKKFGDDFVTATVNWIRPIFLEEDKKLVEKLETNPMEPQTQNRLATQMEDLLEKEDFRKTLIELLEKSKQYQQTINTNSMSQGAQSVGIQGSNFQGATVHINIGTSDTAEKKKLSDYTEGSLQEQLKNQIADGKLSDVLETIIQRGKNDEDRKNTAYLQLGRWNSINREIDKGIVSRENASVELNKIKSAVLKMVDELD